MVPAASGVASCNLPDSLGQDLWPGSAARKSVYPLGVGLIGLPSVSDDETVAGGQLEVEEVQDLVCCGKGVGR